ncbi:MAG TPA: hypothetical protein VHK05_07660 [Candidatus Limnocylindrales bacterium]|nr:hypothetical protein [Candidatus Limnocylindrales bacterium]
MRSAVPAVPYDVAGAPSATVVGGSLHPAPAARDLDTELPWSTATAPASGAPGAPVGSDDGQVDGADDDIDGALPDGDDGGSSTAGPAWAVGSAGLGATRTPTYMPRPSHAVAPPPAPSFDGPGAYVPPMPVAVVPAGPPAPAREWAGHAAIPDLPPAASVEGAAAAPAPAADRQARFAEFIGWLSVAGAAFAAVGFLLPWGLVVIGSAGVGYFDRWGLSGPGHLIVALGMLAILALALIKNDIPVWIRTGLVGLGAGAYLLGLVWPYVFGLPGTGPGAVIAAIGAVALAVAGLLALITDRHGRADRTV